MTTQTVMASRFIRPRTLPAGCRQERTLYVETELIASVNIEAEPAPTRAALENGCYASLSFVLCCFYRINCESSSFRARSLAAGFSKSFNHKWRPSGTHNVLISAEKRDGEHTSLENYNLWSKVSRYGNAGQTKVIFTLILKRRL